MVVVVVTGGRVTGATGPLVSKTSHGLNLAIVQLRDTYILDTTVTTDVTVSEYITHHQTSIPCYSRPCYNLQASQAEATHHS